MEDDVTGGPGPHRRPAGRLLAQHRGARAGHGNGNRADEGDLALARRDVGVDLGGGHRLAGGGAVALRNRHDGVQADGAMAARPVGETMMGEKRWYAVHTYSGFENKAKKSLEEKIKLEGLTEHFGEILIPVEQVVEMVKGEKKTSKRKF